jgi:hypothetical protein
MGDPGKRRKLKAFALTTTVSFWGAIFRTFKMFFLIKQTIITECLTTKPTLIVRETGKFLPMTTKSTMQHRQIGKHYSSLEYR